MTSFVCASYLFRPTPSKNRSLFCKIISLMVNHSLILQRKFVCCLVKVKHTVFVRLYYDVICLLLFSTFIHLLYIYINIYIYTLFIFIIFYIYICLLWLSKNFSIYFISRCKEITPLLLKQYDQRSIFENFVLNGQ